MLTVLPEEFIQHQGIRTIDCGHDRLHCNSSHCSQAYQIANVPGADHNDSPNLRKLSQSNAMRRNALSICLLNSPEGRDGIDALHLSDFSVLCATEQAGIHRLC